MLWAEFAERLLALCKRRVHRHGRGDLRPRPLVRARAPACRTPTSSTTTSSSSTRPPTSAYGRGQRDDPRQPRRASPRPAPASSCASLSSPGSPTRRRTCAASPGTWRPAPSRSASSCCRITAWAWTSTGGSAQPTRSRTSSRRAPTRCAPSPTSSSARASPAGGRVGSPGEAPYPSTSSLRTNHLLSFRHRGSTADPRPSLRWAGRRALWRRARSIKGSAESESDPLDLKGPAGRGGPTFRHAMVRDACLPRRRVSPCTCAAGTSCTLRAAASRWSRTPDPPRRARAAGSRWWHTCTRRWPVP